MILFLKKIIFIENFKFGNYYSKLLGMTFLVNNMKHIHKYSMTSPS